MTIKIRGYYYIHKAFNSGFKYIFLFLLTLNWSGCVILFPWIGTYKQNPGASATAGNYNSKTGCTTEGSVSRQEILRLTADKAIFEERHYSDTICSAKYYTIETVTKYQTREVVDSRVVTTDATNSTGTLGTDTFSAVEVDLMNQASLFTCFTSSCADIKNLEYAAYYAELQANNPEKAEHCNIVFAVGEMRNVTRCLIVRGAFSKNITYDLMYYDEKEAAFYNSSSYAAPADNQPGNFFTGISTETRPKYINMDMWFDKVSPDPNYGMQDKNTNGLKY